MQQLKLSVGIVSCTALLLLSACQPLHDEQSSNTKHIADTSLQTPQLEKKLASHTWQLTAFFGDKVHTTGNTNINFSLQNKGISGSAGCNRYFGSYTLQQHQLSFSQLGTTKMMCMNMAEEDAFFKNISQVNRFQIQDHILTFFDDAMPLMQFTMQSSTKGQ